ncbi:putative holin-like toxin [Lactiplantibacillus plantarum]|nr:putative holin-like toxin [Lactiplantibacillus plantarum]
MSVSDALQLMLAFGTFIVALIALIVELMKSQQKNSRLSSGKLAAI